MTTEVSAPAVILHNAYPLHRAELLDGYYERYVINFADEALEEIAGIRETVRFFKDANMTVIRLTEEMRDTVLQYVSRYPVMSEDNGSTLVSTFRCVCGSTFRASITAITTALPNIRHFSSKEEYRDWVRPGDLEILDYANTLSGKNIIHFCAWEAAPNRLSVWKDYKSAAVSWSRYMDIMDIGEAKKQFGCTDLTGKEIPAEPPTFSARPLGKTSPVWYNFISGGKESSCQKQII